MNNFNWALLIGCFLIAGAILIVGNSVAHGVRSISHNVAHIPMHMPHFPHSQEPGEFLRLFEASNFIGIDFDAFHAMLDAGEFSGTYAAFEVERRVYRWEGRDRWVHADGTFAEWPDIPISPPTEFDIITETLRIFSREKLADWMNERIGNHAN